VSCATAVREDKRGDPAKTGSPLRELNVDDAVPYDHGDGYVIGADAHGRGHALPFPDHACDVHLDGGDGCASSRHVDVILLSWGSPYV